MAKTPDHMIGVDSIGRTTSKVTSSKSFMVPDTKAPAQGHNHRKHKRTHAKHATFDSTCLQSATFFPKDETLVVTFVSGETYDYDCDPETWSDLKSADSIGIFFNEEIRE